MLMRLLELGSGRVCKGRDPPRPPAVGQACGGQRAGAQPRVSRPEFPIALEQVYFCQGESDAGLGLWVWVLDLGIWEKMPVVLGGRSGWGIHARCPPPRVLGIKPVSFQELFCPEAALSSCGPPSPQPASDPEVGRGQRC